MSDVLIVIIILWMRKHTGRCFHVRGKKCRKMMLNINWAAKTPLDGLSMRVVRSIIGSSLEPRKG